MTSSTPGRWTKVTTLAAIEPGVLRSFKLGGQPLVVSKTESGELFALDNRCPHEGYPLSTGALKGCALTCCWHNWKFDVRDGHCDVGGEGVRAFPIRIDGDDVLVDLSDRNPATLLPGLRASLAEGLLEHDNARAIRDAMRLIEAGADPHRLLAEISAWDARHGEWGLSHGVAVAADCGRLLHHFDGADVVAAMAPAIDQIGDAQRRRPTHSAVGPISSTGDTGAAIRSAIEHENLPAAEGLLRGAHAAGVDRATIEGWLYAAVSDHFLSFGHPLIYLVKVQELLDRAGGEHAEEIHVGLLRSIAYATREDTLPYMAIYRRRLHEAAPEFDALHQATSTGAPFDRDRFRDVILDGSPAAACDALMEALHGGVLPRKIATALAQAGSHRLLRFDVAHERDPDVAENWLWATHRFTFTSAVRNAIERFPHPDRLRFLFQAVMFVNSGRSMDLPAENRPETSPGEDRSATLAGLDDAISRRDPDTALSIGRALLAGSIPAKEWRAHLELLVLGDRFVAPIYTSHAIKVMIAALEEHDALGDHPDRGVPVLAALRFLASPVSERAVRKDVYTARRFVVDGVIPRKLTQ